MANSDQDSSRFAEPDEVMDDDDVEHPQDLLITGRELCVRCIGSLSILDIREPAMTAIVAISILTNMRRIR